MRLMETIIVYNVNSPVISATKWDISKRQNNLKWLQQKYPREPLQLTEMSTCLVNYLLGFWLKIWNLTINASLGLNATEVYFLHNA